MQSKNVINNFCSPSKKVFKNDIPDPEFRIRKSGFEIRNPDFLMVKHMVILGVHFCIWKTGFQNPGMAKTLIISIIYAF